MDVISQIEDLEAYVKGIKKAEKSSGFVPTMGALHQGHLSLMERSVKENDISMASIFVNPLQFNNSEDLAKYPKDLENDLEMLKSIGCDMVFTPDHQSFYKEKPQIKIQFGHLDKVLEGEFRPGHFNGVAIVVSRLLHLSQADNAYFGLKDLQQYYIIHRMCLDLGINTNIIPCEIIRERDGLAMSSRNRRLSSSERIKAATIYKALIEMKTLLKNGNSFQDARKKLETGNIIDPQIKIEYLELIKLPDFILNPDLNSKSEYAICIAAFLSEIRLIDNIRFAL